MRFTTQTRPPMTSPSDQFYCSAKRRFLSLSHCLDDFMNATSLEKRRSACFRCPLGRRNREAYAASGETD